MINGVVAVSGAQQLRLCPFKSAFPVCYVILSRVPFMNLGSFFNIDFFFTLPAFLRGDSGVAPTPWAGVGQMEGSMLPSPPSSVSRWPSELKDIVVISPQTAPQTQPHGCFHSLPPFPSPWQLPVYRLCVSRICLFWVFYISGLIY